MSERISLDALEFLAFLEESKYFLKSPQKVGQLGQELVEAGYAEVYRQEVMIPVFPVCPTPIISQRFLTLATTYEYSLRPTPQGIIYLKEHQKDLERLAEA